MLSILLYSCIGLAFLSLLLTFVVISKLKVALPKRLNEPAFCDLLDYATLVSDNVIALKSGALMSMFKIAIPDLSIEPESKVNHFYSLVQKALLKLNGNYCVQFDIVRHQSQSYLPTFAHNAAVNCVIKDLEERRSKLFQDEGCFTSDLILTITYVGNNKTNEQIDKILEQSSTTVACQQIIDTFVSTCNSVIDTLQICFEVTPLTYHLKDLWNNTTISAECMETYKQLQKEKQAKNKEVALLNKQRAKKLVQKHKQISKIKQAYKFLINNLNAKRENGAVYYTSFVEDEKALEETWSKELKKHVQEAKLSNASETFPLTLSKNTATKLASNQDKSSVYTLGINLEHVYDYVYLIDPNKAQHQSKVRMEEQVDPAPLKTIDPNYQWVTDAIDDLKSINSHHVLIHDGLTFIHQCITGKEHDIAYPQKRAFLDSILSSEDFKHGFTPQIGNQHICVLALEGLPPCSVQGLLNSLASLPYSYRFNTRFIYFDNLKSALLLEKYRRYWAQKSKGILAQLFNLENVRLNKNALDQMQEIDDAKRALDHNEVVFGAYTATLILMNSDLDTLNQQSNNIIQTIENLGLSVRIETVNATEAFLGSLPGHYHENLRRPIISQDVLSDLIPLSLPDQGERSSPNPFYGANASPLMQVRVKGKGNYYLNLHNQDLANTLVVGPPGSGKSVLLGALMVNLLRYPQMRLFTFDKGYSFYALTKALGGTHIVFDNSQALLCPLAYLQTEQDFDFALDFIETLAKLNKIELTPYDKGELLDCLKILATRKRRSLSELHFMVTSKNVKQAIAPYTRYSKDNCLLDASTNIKLNQGITTFECSELFANSNNFSIPVLKQVFHSIARQFDGRPAAIILDEAWLMLKDETFCNELIKWFKTLRKFNVFVILATQSLSDLATLPSFDNLLDCVKTRIYLANYDAKNEQLRPLYQKMGLDDPSINTIADATPKQDYLFVKNAHKILFNLMLSQPELALLSFSGDHCVKVVDQLYNKYGEYFYTRCSLKNNQEQETS